MKKDGKEIVIPPSPNWYLSNVFECHRRTGVLAYAASRCIVFIWPTEPNREISFPHTRVVPDAHMNKVTCVSWYEPSEDDNLLLASGGEDGRICVWKANDQTLLMEHDVHEAQKISCLAWLQTSEKKVLASSSDSGNVIITEVMLNYESCTTRKLNFGKINPTTLSFSPHTPWQLAIGCKGGLLYICDIRENRGVIHKLRGHEEDVHSVVWCPTKGNKVLRPDDTKETFLATSGRDKTIKIWAAEGGKCVLQAKLPGNTGFHRPRSGHHQEDKRSTWVALHWLDERRILSSGLSGELVSWEIGTQLSWKIVHKLHTRGLFNISSFTEMGNENPRTMIWTSAQDRNVILYPFVENLTKKEILGIPEMENPCLCLPTMGGFVYTLSNNPLDSSHMALGLGDGSIRLWNMAAGKPEMAMLWNGIKGKVTALAWHPSVEGLLAFGTDEGRVGIFDTLNVTKPPTLSRTYHKGTVYNLVWAPTPTSKEGVMHLYSCGGSHIFIHDRSALEAEAKNFNVVIGEKQKQSHGKFPSRTDLQWKTDYSLLAVGNEDGSVEIYSGRDFSLLLIIVAHKKLIQCLKWHPLYTFQSTEPSKLGSWLAVTSSDTVIKVFDISSTTEDQPPSYTLVSSLTGHKERVVSVSWDPHQDGILLSASYDGTAQVWDVANKKPLANFGGHSGRVLCCDWNPLESNTAITGSDDLTLRIWKVTDQVNSTPAETLATRTEKKKTGFKPAVCAVPQARQPHSTTGGAKKKAATKLKSLFPVSAVLEARGRNEGLADIKIIASLKGIPLKHSVVDDPPGTTHVFPVEDFGQDHLTHLGFFCDSNSTRQMLQEEIEHHEEGSNNDLATHFKIWMGDVESALREAVKRKQLNEWLVSLAPQVSLEFWKEMTRLYAEQLLAEGDTRKAVSYALISGQTSRAVEMFSSQQQYRESVALTRCIYPDGSSQVRESLSRWAGKAIQDGNVELGVKCLLSNNETAEAARVLARRSDPASLKLSADLAYSAGLDQLAGAYLHQAAEVLALATESAPSPTPSAGSEEKMANGEARSNEVNDIALPQPMGEDPVHELADHCDKLVV